VLKAFLFYKIGEEIILSDFQIKFWHDYIEVLKTFNMEVITK